MPPDERQIADYVRALRLLHGAINDVRDMMDEDQREQMEWRNLYAAEDAIKALEAATFCPHSLVSAEGVCQMCGREGIDRIQVTDRYDPSWASRLAAEGHSDGSPT